MKICPRRLLATLLIAACTGAPALAQPLSTLLPGEGVLPKGCAARPLDESAPPFLETNPQVSADTAFVEAFWAMFFGDEAEPAGLEEALVAVYEAGEGDELGVFGFGYASEEAAAQAAENLFANMADDGMEVFTGPTAIALVWRDRGPGPCFAALRAHVQAALQPEAAE